MAERYGDGPVTPWPRPPRCSFGHGAAGVAYFLIRYASLAAEPAVLDRATQWVTLAVRDRAEPGAFVGDPPMFPDRRTALPSSLLFGEAGVWWTASLVHAAAGDATAAAQATDRFCDLAAACSDDALDVASGAAGLLLGAAVLREQLGALAPERLVSVGDALARRLDAVGPCPSGLSGWLGAAHGSCGLVHARLRWCRAGAIPPSPALESSLTALRAVRLPEGVWPRRDGAAEVWPGWCHGSAGWAELWVLAAEVLHDDALLAVAEAPGVHAVIARGGGAGLCCGVAGQAYAAVALYQATSEPVWLTSARRLVAEVEANAQELPAHSLWAGDVGAALLALELQDPEEATMPAYGPHR